MGSSWRTALALIATVVVVAGAAVVFLLIHSSSNPVETATVAAAYLATVAIAITLLMPLGPWWWKGRGGATAHVSTQVQVAAAADWLAEAMEYRWQLEATGRRIVTPAPATVRWRWAADEVTAPRAEVTTSPAPGTGPSPLPDLGRPGELLATGVVTCLHDEVYARLPHGRLVLIGGPGAGKTGAMILLLLAALDRRRGLTGDQRERVPVPVWLTLGGWNPASMSLRDWAVGTMDRDYPALRAPDYGPDVADELLRAGRLALFLDGLDEMPEGLRPLALKHVDGEARGLRVVVTSRPEEYRGAVQVGRPDNTAVIELRPVRPRWAADYLLHGQTGPSRQRWEQVGAYLTHNPDSVAARALDNPLTLSLARDTYTSQDPTVLTDPSRFPTVEAVREHLMDHFLITAYPNERERAHAIWWLSWIACHMGSSQDLRWWDIPTWIPRWKLRLTRGLAAGLATGLTAATAVGLAVGFRHGPATGLAVGVGVGLYVWVVVLVVVGLLTRLRTKPARAPQTLAPRRKRPLTLVLVFVLVFVLAVTYVELGVSLSQSVSTSGQAKAMATTTVLAGVITAGTFGLMLGILILLSFGPSGRSGFGLAGAPQTLVPRWPRRRELGWIIAIGLVFFPLLVPAFLNLWATPVADSPSSTAARTYRIDRRTSLIYGLVYGLALGLAAGIGGGLAAGIVAGLVAGLTSGLVFGLAFWFVAGQVPLVKLTELILIPQRPGRVHFLHLLEDAFGRQVLRQAGALYQFRHAALQAHLAAMHRQPPTS